VERERGDDKKITSDSAPRRVGHGQLVPPLDGRQLVKLGRRLTSWPPGDGPLKVLEDGPAHVLEEKEKNWEEGASLFDF
jgi:hypothetical protein